MPATPYVVGAVTGFYPDENRNSIIVVQYHRPDCKRRD
jgi:hypothetical protein